MADEYIVKSGVGYFVRFIIDNISEMDSDPVCAARMSEDEALEVISRLDNLGFCADPIRIIHARIKEVV